MFWSDIAEKSCIAACLSMNDAVKLIVQYDDDIFYSAFYRKIFQIIKSIEQNKGVVSLNIVYLKLEKEKDLSGRFLNEFSEFQVFSHELDACVDTLVYHYKKRKYYFALESGLADLKNGKEVEEVENVIDASYKSIEFEKEDGVDAVDIKLDSIFSLSEQVVPSGFDNLDEHIQGFAGTRLYVLAAKTSCGKTTFSVNIAQNICKAKTGAVLFFSLEMKAEDLMYIILSNDLELPLDRIRKGMISSEEKSKIDGYIPRIKELYKELIFFGPQYQDLSVIKKAIIRSCRRKKPGLIIIDYLQLIKVPWIKEKRHKVNEASQVLKNLAGELDVPILELSQFRRFDKKEWPQLDHLKESGDIENDADVVMFLHYEEKSDKRWVIVAKNKFGPTGKDRLYWHKEFYKFIDYIDC
jgi:replicative DNA helicase